jgi:polyhydroxyalkanoate synthase
MVNKYYVLDIQPGRSLIEHLVSQGFTVFTTSWRNPQREHGHWGFDDYASAVLGAMTVCEEIAGSDAVHVVAMCAGGLVACGAGCVLEARGERDRLRSLTLCLTAVDTAYPGAAGSMVTPETAPWLHVEAARRGYVEASQLAGTFAWTKPNEGVWTFWVNNYVLGKRPPAVDILYWAADATNVPGALNRDMVRISLENAFARDSGLTVLGVPIDAGTISCPNYIMAAETDHLTPWHGCYPAVHILGGRSRFVLGNRGHVGAVVNPGGRSARYRTGSTTGRSADEWLEAAKVHTGTWWKDWVPWLRRRSGDLVAAAAGVGSLAYPPIEDAPGRYVRVRGD